MSVNMNEPEYENLKENSWQRPLTPAEEVDLHNFLAANASTRADWDEETALNRMLDGLPDVPVSSNFTALVIRRVRRIQVANKRFEGIWPAWWRNFGWLPRLAIACLTVSFSVISVYEYQQAQMREIVRGAEEVSTFAAVPKIDWLQNFDTIKRLNQVSPVDEDLLAALR